MSISSYRALPCLLAIIALVGCNKIKELKEDPDLSPVKQGFKATSAISYCASLAVMAFQGENLPNNVRLTTNSSSEYSKSILLYVDTDTNSPLPFNSHIGEVIIGGIWDADQESGVISIIFGNLNIFEGEHQFFGLHTVPIKRKVNGERFITVFAQQDIVIGQGSDTLLDLGLSRIKFDLELERLEKEQPDDVFVAVQQNAWFIQFYQNDVLDVYDDSYEINGGGQIVSANTTSGGVTYHAMIETKYTVANCDLNPDNGTAFIQNVKAGDGVDLGNIMLDFHSDCDGKADVTFATGRYVSSNGRAVNLDFN